MAKFLRHKLGKRRSRSSLEANIGSVLSGVDADETSCHDIGSCAHYSRKPLVSSSTIDDDDLSNMKTGSAQESKSLDPPCKTAQSRMEIQVVPEDYIQPVDAIVPRVPLLLPQIPPLPVPTATHEDYTEPYEMRKTVLEFDSRLGRSRSQSTSCSPADPRVNKTNNCATRCSLNESKSLITFKEHSSNSENPSENYKLLLSLDSQDQSDYDRSLIGARTNSLSSPNPLTGKSKITYQEHRGRNNSSKVLTSSPGKSIATTADAKNNNGNHFSNSINGSCDSNPLESATYCRPWDLGNVKQQLKSSMETSSNIPRHFPTPKLSNPPNMTPNQHQDSVVYDAPWDISAKQKQIEMKLKASHALQKTASGASAEQVYEEPWDVGSRGKAISDMLINTGAEKGSPGSKRSPANKGNKIKSSSCSQMDPGMTKALSAIGEPINPSLPLDKQMWFHGAIGRSDAESVLRTCREGSYLVRNCESSKQSFSLSMKSPNGFIHIKIERSDDHFILGENSQPFETISSMIYHYSRNLLPIKGADHMILLHPVHEVQ